MGSVGGVFGDIFGKPNTGRFALPGPVPIQDVGGMTQDAVQTALAQNPAILAQQQQMFPGIFNAINLYNQRVAQPVPQDVINDITNQMRAEQAIRSPGSYQSPALSLQNAMGLSQYLEQQRMNAANMASQLSMPFTQRPIQPSELLNAGLQRQGLNVGQYNARAQSTPFNNMNIAGQLNRYQDTLSGLLGMGASGAQMGYKGMGGMQGLMGMFGPSSAGMSAAAAGQMAPFMTGMFGAGGVAAAGL